MKLLTKLFTVLLSLTLLTGCNFLGDKDLGTEDIDQEVQEIIEAEHEIDEEIVELESSGIDDLDSLDEEVDSIIEEEASIDEELDQLESEDL